MKALKTISMAAGLAALALCATACRNMGPYITEVPGGAGAIGTTPGGGTVTTPPPPPPVETATGGARVPEREPVAFGSADETAAKLNLSVSVTGSGDEGPAVAAEIETAVEGTLAGLGFRLTADDPDVQVLVSASASEFDRERSYYIFKVDALSSAMRAYDRKVLGKQTFLIRGTRTLGRAAAIQSASRQAGHEISGWLSTTCSASKAGLRASMVEVAGAWESGEGAAYVERLVGQVRGLDGVVSCRVNEVDYGRGRARLRVVYFEDKFPTGIVNRIAALPGSNLKPR